MRSRRLELGSRTLLLVAACIPGFWMALGLLVIVANWLPFIPVAGYGSPANYLLPVIVLGLAPSALLIRLVRSSIREQLGMDYVRTARSRGIGNRSIVFRHVMPGIVAPVIALTGVRLGAILTGSIIIEPIFAWPGIGSLVIASISGRDLPVLAGVLLLVAVAVVVANLLADLAIAAIDPRVRWGAQIGVSR
jgi:ABC-type dipeptide/oligopeptide/nickel transport system permease component